MLRKMLVVALALCLPFAMACNKAPAQAAIAAAEKAIETARPTVEVYAHRDFQELTRALASAKTKFQNGEYSIALKEATEIPAKVEAATKAAMTAKETLTKEWTALAASLPGFMESIGNKLKTLATTKKLPAGLDKAKLEGANAAFGTVSQIWKDAETAFASGNVKDALAKAKEVTGKAQELMSTLGLSPAAVAPQS